jgi:hypothetical protein
MTFTIDTENNITAHGTPEEAAGATATPFDSFTSEQELAGLACPWPANRLVAIWNSLPGVTPVKKFKDHKTAISRVWKRIQGLVEPEKPQRISPKSRRRNVRPRVAHGRPKGAPAKAKAPKASAAKGRAKKAAKAKEAAAPREGSKTAQVVAMLQRKNGATLTEIMDKMGWQKHTVRGFMAGAMKKAGYQVESFKPEGGERTYRLCGAPHKR